MKTLRSHGAMTQALAWPLAACFVSFAAAAVLNPYALPSQQSNAPRQQQSGSGISVGDSYYQRFAEQTRALNKDERAALVRNFSGKKEAALQTGHVEEAQHYTRLVQILEANK